MESGSKYHILVTRYCLVYQWGRLVVSVGPPYELVFGTLLINWQGIESSAKLVVYTNEEDASIMRIRGLL